MDSQIMKRTMVLVAVVLISFIGFSTIATDQSEESDALTSTTCNVTVGDTWSSYKVAPTSSSEGYSGSIPGITLTVQIIGGQPFLIGNGTFTSAGTYYLTTDLYSITVNVSKEIVTDTVNAYVGDDYSHTFSEYAPYTSVTVSGSIPGITVTKPTDNPYIPRAVFEGTFTTAGTYNVTIEFAEKVYNVTYVITKQSVPVTSISIDASSSQVEVGSTITLTATASPSGATDPTVTWSISGTNIVSKQSTSDTTTGGKIVLKGLATGTAIITATANDGSGKSDQFSLTVIKPTVLVETITLSGDTVVEVGSSIDLTAKCDPDDATDRSVTFSFTTGSTRASLTQSNTNDGSVAILTGLKAGSCRVIATANDGSGVTSNYLTIRIVEPTISVTSIEITGPTEGNEVDGVRLTATVSPSDATEQTLKWTSSTASITEDGDYVIVRGTGLVTVRATATDGSGVYDEVTITFNPVYTVTFDPNGGSCNTTSLTWTKGQDSLTLPAATRASDQVFKGWYTMTSGGDYVGTTGDIYTPSMNITLYAQWAEKVNPVESIEISGSNAVNVGQTVTLSAIAFPDTASNRHVVWSISSGSGFITLSNHIQKDSGGTVDVTGVAKGTAVVQARAEDGTGIVESFTIVVQEEVVTYAMSLTYNLMGGTDGPENLSYPNETNSTKNISISTLEPKKSGFTFVGWSESPGFRDNILSPGDPITLNAGIDLVLYAEWDEITTYFDLNFVPTPGTGGPTTLHELESGTTHRFTIPTDLPTLEGFECIGWSLIQGSTTASYFPGGYFTATNQSSTLYAVWAEETVENTFVLVFDMQGGTGGPGDMSITSTASTYSFDFPAAAPNKPGYNFIGWATSAGSGTAKYVYGVDTKIPCSPGTTRLYAVYSQDGYSLILKNNDGTSNQKVITEYDSSGGHTFIIPNDYIPTTVSSGYIFDGWAETADGSVKYSPGDMYPTSQATSYLYAKWTKELTTTTYTIIYYHNDGTTQSFQESASFAPSDTKVMPATSTVITRTGYTFMGWSDTSNSTVALYTAGDSVSLYSTTTKLYAVWKLNPITYYVSFNGNDANATNTPAPVSNTVSATSCTIQLPSTEPVLTGKVFLGWSKSSTATVSSYSAGSTITVTTTSTVLYAVWGDYNVTWNLFFDANGGIGAPDTITATAPHTAHTSQLAKDVLPPREGYIVLGGSIYKTATTASNNPGGSFNTNSLNSTLYAVWTPVPTSSFTLKYDLDGGANGPTTFGPISGIDSYTTQISGPEPSKNGYTFKGWALTRGGEVRYQTYMYITLEAEVTTLYAVWEKLEIRTFALEFNLMGGIGDVSVAPYTGTEEFHEFTIPGVIPVLNDVQFVGWAETSDGEPVCFAGGKYLANPGTTTLYAVWYSGTKVPFYLHYEMNGGINGPSDQKGEGFGSYLFKVSEVAPELEGFKFTGWSTAPNGAVQYGKGDEIIATSMVTVLYAQWESAPVMKTYILNLDPNGGDGADQLSMGSLSGFAAFIIPTDVVPTLDGYSFGGWALTPDGPARFGLGDTFFTKDPESTLYAHWVPYGTTEDPIEPITINPKMTLKVNGNTLYYNASETTGVNENVSYTWVFGDGSNSMEISGTHIYSSPGQYTVSLRVLCDGQMKSVSETITVGSDNSDIIKIAAMAILVTLVLVAITRYFGLA